MATKPSGDVPNWATDGGALLSDPGVAKRSAGFLTSERPPAHWINWLYGRAFEWIDYIHEEINVLATAAGVALDADDKLKKSLDVIYGRTRPYLIGRARNLGASLDLGAAGSPRAAVMSVDGTKLYVVSGSSDSILQYSLAERWVAASAVDSGKSKSIATEDGNISAVRFKPDGTSMFVNGSQTDTIYQYPLTTPWELDTAGASNGSWSYAGDTTDGTAFDIGNDGTVLLLADQSNDSLRQYLLSTPWAIGTVGAVNATFGFPVNDVPSGVQWRNDGTQFIVAINQVSNLIRSYDVGTPWDINSSPSLAEELDVTADVISSVGDIYLTPKGHTLLAMNATELLEYLIHDFAAGG